jgi:hypothetical protein
MKWKQFYPVSVVPNVIFSLWLDLSVVHLFLLSRNLPRNISKRVVSILQNSLDDFIYNNNKLIDGSIKYLKKVLPNNVFLLIESRVFVEGVVIKNRTRDCFLLTHSFILYIFVHVYPHSRERHDFFNGVLSPLCFSFLYIHTISSLKKEFTINISKFLAQL